jgi:hypothetical protein
VNKRWVTFSVRCGTVLMVAGLALVMLSLIPPRAIENTDFRQTLNLQPETFTYDLTFFLSVPVDPQHGFYLNAKANNSVTAYLLNVGREYVQQWIVSQIADVQPSHALNISILEKFLKDHPASVTWQEKVADEAVKLQYAPTRLANITLVFSNPNTEAAKVEYDGRLLNFIVPSERALNPAKVAIPTGFILTLPWLNSTRKTKKNHIRN